MDPVRVGVWGTGAWGEKHARVYAGLAEARLVGVYDRDPARAAAVAAHHGTRAFDTPEALLEACEAVSIAVPTVAHRAARRAATVLQVGQVERFNPAMNAARPSIRHAKFIEAHRLALFQPRSLDIDVVFDLMIHDIDIVLQAAGSLPTAVSAVGVAVLSDNEDIANARLEFADGCVANLTASRVSQERLRRIRFFQDDAYLSIDLFGKTCEHLELDRSLLSSRQLHPLQLAAAIRKHAVEVVDAEPLGLELSAFLRSLRGEGQGAASAVQGRDALAVAESVRAGMKQRARQWTLPQNAAS